MKKGLCDVIVVMDRSGSMQNIRCGITSTFTVHQDEEDLPPIPKP